MDAGGCAQISISQKKTVGGGAGGCRRDYDAMTRGDDGANTSIANGEITRSSSQDGSTTDEKT